MSTMLDPHYSSAGNYYSAGADRIVKYLAATGLPHPQAELLKKALLDHFDSRDYLQARALLEKSDPSDWHMVVPGSESPVFCRRGLELASSQMEGLASILEICDEKRVFLKRCEQTPEGLRLYDDHVLVAELKRVEFEPYRADHYHRVDSALKGIRRYGEEGRLISRLKTIPGFDSIDFKVTETRHKQPSGCMVISSPTNWASAMMAVMEEVGTSVKRHLAQELVARLFNVDSWQHLVARTAEERVWNRPHGIYITKDPLAWRFFKTSSESVFDFAKTLSAWDGEPLIINEASLAYMSDAGLYLEAVPKNTPEDEPPSFSIICSPPDLVELSDSALYRDLAADFLNELESNGNPIALLKWSGDLDEDIRTANERMGTPPSQALRIGNWWLRVLDFDRKHLLIERMTDGKTRDFRESTPLYKATIRYNNVSRELSVYGDYEDVLVATIPNVTQREVHHLCELITIMPSEEEPPLWGRGDIRGPAPWPGDLRH